MYSINCICSHSTNFKYIVFRALLQREAGSINTEKQSRGNDHYQIFDSLYKSNELRHEMALNATLTKVRNKVNEGYQL